MTRPHTPDRVTALEPGQVFVFGSNDRGLHAGGAARDAVTRFGAIWGQARGLQGDSYAIVTMGEDVDLESIRAEVQQLFGFARANPQLTFLMTRIGTGIAGLPEAEMKALFGAATPDNIWLPRGWDPGDKSLSGD
jgi:hypothetical protein